MQEFEIKANFSKNIKELRLSKKMNQTEFGERINYSSKAVSKWENGDVLPDITTLKMLADYFDITVDELISSKDALKKSHRRQNHLLITIVSSFLPFLISSLIFLILVLCNVPKNWISYIAALPASAVVLVVFTALWYDHKALTGAVIFLVWSLALLIMILMNFDLFWIFIIIASILSVLAIIFFNIRFTSHRENKK